MKNVPASFVRHPLFTYKIENHQKAFLDGKRLLVLEMKLLREVHYSKTYFTVAEPKLVLNFFLTILMLVFLKSCSYKEGVWLFCKEILGFKT